MTDKEIIIDGANTLKEKINMCFILLSNKLETTETIERTIYEHLDAFVDEWNDLFQRKEQECEKLINKNNILKTNINQIELLLEGKNTQYNVLREELEKLKSQIETYSKMHSR